MMRLDFMTLLLCVSSIVGMEKQIELRNRHAYMKQTQNERQNAIQANTQKKCPFCDPLILAQNNVVERNEEINAMIMMNNNPYFEQGFHLMIMPISHTENPLDFFSRQLKGQVAAMLKFSSIFHDESVIQEFVTSWGPTAGQSQEHLHAHLKTYLQESCSLYERTLRDQNVTKNDDRYKFDAVKALWNSSQQLAPTSATKFYSKKCDSCEMIKELTDDEKNFVIGRFKYNVVCLSNRPNVPVQVHVIPNEHLNTFKDLSFEPAHENIALATALLSRLRTFAQEHIVGGCQGANWLTTSLGANASERQHKEYPHLQTIVIPRLNMPLSPGTLVGMTCKLDFNPIEFMTYMKNFKDEFQKLNQD